MVNNLEESLEVPEDYPEDILPLYSKEMILTVMTNPDESMSLVCLTKDPAQKVIDYYNKVLEDATVMMDEKDEDYLMSMGQLKGGATYTVLIDVVDEEDYKGFETTFVVTTMPGFDMDGMTGDDKDDDGSDDQDSSDGDGSEDKEDSDSGNIGGDPKKEEAEIIVPEGIKIPDSYPKEEVPFYPTGKTEAAMAGEGMMAIMTEDELEDVLDYYRELLEESEDFNELNMPPMIMMSGTIDGKSVQFMIGENTEETGEDPRFKTLIQIMYQ